MYSCLPGGSTLGISGWGCAAGTLEPLAFTRAFTRTFTRESFRWIFLPYTSQITPILESFQSQRTILRESLLCLWTRVFDFQPQILVASLPVSLVTCCAMPSTYVRIIIINCLILTNINTTDFRLNHDF